MHPRNPDARAEAISVAMRTFPWAAKSWQRIRELLLQAAEADEPGLDDTVQHELKDLFERRAEEMAVFVQQVLPPELFPDHWRHVDPAEIHGTPFMEDWFEKLDREMHAAVRENPIRRIYPNLLTDPFARNRALRIAEDILRVIGALNGASTTPDAPEAKYGQSQITAIRNYGPRVVAALVAADKAGLTAEELAGTTGCSTEHIANRVLSYLRSAHLIDYDDKTHRWYAANIADSMRQARQSESSAGADQPE
jgi:hypothetical protein